MASTPRPSISPLSARASPILVRDTRQQLEKDQDDDDDDDRSSSLSEPDDDIDEEEEQGDSNFEIPSTEQQSAHHSLEVDSEAETERIDQTPAKLRKDADTTQKTPSKLSQAVADDELSDPPSPVPVVPGAASSTSTVETAGKKRKRSDTADSSLTSAESDLGESPRKRSHSAAADDNATAEDAIEDAPEPTEIPNEVGEIEDDGTATIIPPKVGRGRKGGRPKGKMKKDATKDNGTEKAEAEEDAQPEGEQSEETTVKSAEEIQHKQDASTRFEDIAKQFTAYREKINNERLAAVEAELDMLNQPDCQHPEYMRQAACVEARRQKQINEAKAFYRFKSESIKRTTLAERSQLHSQYFQSARELREEVMAKLGEDWYDIQKERRQSHQEKDDAYIFKFPTKRSDQVKQQAKYNTEVSILSGVAKYVGFPSAPDISGCAGDILEDDLKAMKISKRPQKTSVPQQPLFAPSSSVLMDGQRERLAHAQYLEQNAWARPQIPLGAPSIPNHGTPNLTHTPDWAAEPGAFGREQVSPLTVSKQRQNGGGELIGFRNISGASTVDAVGD